MNTLSRPSAPSRASATTQCQKCLQRGHYSYECKTALADRPYTARPSRTQQLKNPALKPKLSDTKPPEDDLTQKQGVADSILAGRARSESVSSVSTISTGRSRSPSTERGRIHAPPRHTSHRARADADAHDGRRSRARDRSPSASSSSDASSHRAEAARRSRDLHSRARRAGGRYRSPSHSRSPVSDREGYAGGRDAGYARFRTREDREGDGPRAHARRSASPRDLDRPSFSRETSRRDLADRYAPDGQRGRAPRERSLSPFSRRMQITQALNA